MGERKPIPLKPCPFCGGPARFFHRWSAGCVDGHAISPEMETSKKAAAWWNMRRRPLPAPPALRSRETPDAP